MVQREQPFEVLFGELVRMEGDYVCQCLNVFAFREDSCGLQIPVSEAPSCSWILHGTVRTTPPHLSRPREGRRRRLRGPARILLSYKRRYPPLHANPVTPAATPVPYSRSSLRPAFAARYPPSEPRCASRAHRRTRRTQSGRFVVRPSSTRRARTSFVRKGKKLLLPVAP